MQDKITMPDAGLFESSEDYYSTFFHELTHATGHVSRLNRKEVTEPNRFGSDPYSREELVAEMGSAFLCGHCGIENKTIDQSANYIQEWLKRLKDDRKLVVQAAAQAQKACDFILNVLPKEEEAPTEQQPKEFKVVALRECPTPEQMAMCDTPEKAVAYWRTHIATSSQFNPECECFAGASAMVLMHNHPSGELQPSEADIKVTRDLVQAGQLLKIDVLDHVVIGNPRYCSLRELGYLP